MDNTPLALQVDSMDTEGRLPLHLAAEQGSMPAVTALVDAMLALDLEVHAKARLLGYLHASLPCLSIPLTHRWDYHGDRS